MSDVIREIHDAAQAAIEADYRRESPDGPPLVALNVWDEINPKGYGGEDLTPAARARALVGLHALMEKIAGARVTCDARNLPRDVYDAMPGEGDYTHIVPAEDEDDYDRFGYSAKWIAPSFTIHTSDRPDPASGMPR